MTATADAFRIISVGGTAIEAEQVGDTLTIIAGNNIEITPNADNDSIEISASGTLAADLPITQDNNGNATNYVVFSGSSTGNLSPKIDTGLYYNPSTGILAVTGIRFGDATTQTTAGGSGEYTLPTSTTSVLGGVKIDGTTITIDESGVISSSSAYSLPTSTTSVLGGVKIDGTTITIDESGVISSIGGGGIDLTNVSTNIVPSDDNTYDLGTPDKRFRHLYVGPGSIYVGDETRRITVTQTSIDLPVGTTIGGEEPLKTTIQNIFNEIINNYLVYGDISGAPTAITDVNQLSDLNNRLTSVAITGITYPENGSSVSTLGDETVTLTGTGFQRACNVYVNGVPAASTSFVSSTSVQFITTAQDSGTYLVTLSNPDATSAVLSPGILYLLPGTPRFTIPSGLLASYNRNASVSKTLTVSGGTPPYTINIASGSLPSGLSLNSSTGVISGTTPDVTFDTVFNFVAQVSDSADPVKSTTSSYYILVALPIPVELTIGGPSILGGSAIISNRAFFTEFEEDITNIPTFTITGTSIISNNTFFVEYEEDITNSPTFTITGTAVKSYTLV